MSHVITHRSHRFRSIGVVITALTLAMVGCDTTETPDLELNREVESVEPDADVEVTPDGEADVDIDPNVSD